MRLIDLIEAGDVEIAPWRRRPHPGSVIRIRAGGQDGRRRVDMLA